jgi:hypothetical protein
MSGVIGHSVGQMKTNSSIKDFPRRCYFYFVPSKIGLNFAAETVRYDYSTDFDYFLAQTMVDKNKKKEQYNKIKRKIFQNFRSSSWVVNELIGMLEIKRKIQDYVRISIETFRNTK